jgi:NO-binding membrane sensor protein with MHYT domain
MRWAVPITLAPGYLLDVKTYLIVTGVIFAAFVGLHVAKAVAEGPSTAKNPLFIFLTALSAGLSLWAWRLLWQSSRSR